MNQREFMHDMANKLVAIAGKTRRLKKKLPDDDADLNKLDSCVQEALKLIKDFKGQPE